jgi:hypothetical protein
MARGMADLTAFLAEHPVVVDHAGDGNLQLVYRDGYLDCPWPRVPGTEKEDVATVLAYLVAQAQTDEQTAKKLRDLLGHDRVGVQAYELLMSTVLTEAGVESEDVLPDEGDRDTFESSEADEEAEAPTRSSAAERTQDESGREPLDSQPPRETKPGGAIIEELQAAALAAEKSRLAYVKATQARNALMRQALKEGWRPAKLARMIGLSREIVGRIGKKEIAEQKAARQAARDQGNA